MHRRAAEGPRLPTVSRCCGLSKDFSPTGLDFENDSQFTGIVTRLVMRISMRNDADIRAGQADLAVRDWLETQARITGYWRDLLVSSGGDDALIAVLDDHASFLGAAARMGEGGFHRPQ
tara:strand:+ start:2013 stop:2369 length:357 start_codon:yes stop_codon:yes gene_type:complete